jgi:hypothetical protein
LKAIDGGVQPLPVFDHLDRPGLFSGKNYALPGWQAYVKGASYDSPQQGVRWGTTPSVVLCPGGSLRATMVAERYLHDAGWSPMSGNPRIHRNIPRVPVSRCLPPGWGKVPLESTVMSC